MLLTCSKNTAIILTRGDEEVNLLTARSQLGQNLFYMEVILMKKSNKGFTLVELIVVIAIIGILAAILVPAMIGYITDSKLSSANSSAKQVYTAINNYCEKIVSNQEPLSCTSLENVKVVGKGTNNTFGADAETAIVKDDINASEANQKAYIASAVGLAMGSEADGTYFSCTFKSGFPEALIWAKSASDPYVGGYPKQATAKYWTLDAAVSGDEADCGTSASFTAST